MFDLMSLAGAISIASLPLAYGQTTSACDPTKQSDCPTKAGLNQAQYEVDFTQPGGLEAAMANWTMTSGNASSTSNGAEFSIDELGQAPTMQSNFYVFFGLIEVTMQAAPGTGIVSSVVLESDDLDEIDWEMLGGDTTQAQSNYFGKGNTTTYDRGQFHDVASPQTTMNTYTVNWTNTSTTWMINGNVVRTLNFADAVGGTNYPQTPCNIRIGNWVGGDPSNSPGTIQWAGGPANMAQGPFNLIVQSVKVTNYNPAQSYKYKDTSGSFESIEILDIVATFADTSGSGTGSGTSNSTSGGQVGQAPVGSTVTIDTATAPGAAATGSSKLTGNANAGSGSSTVTVDLGSSTTAAPVSNSSGGGLVAAGVPANVTHSTVTIDLGSAGTARVNATGGASFVPTATGAGGTAAPAQVTKSAANILTPRSGLVTVLLMLMGIGLALA